MDKTSRDSLRRVTAQLEERDGTAAQQVSDGLFSVAVVLDTAPSLRRAFTDPSSSQEGRRQLVASLFGSQLNGPALEVLQDLVAAPWDGPTDLREAVEVVATTAAMTAAEAAGTLDDVEDELFRFARLLERETALRSALTDHGLPAERKAGLVGSLLATASPTTRRLIELAVTRPGEKSLEGRLRELEQLAAARRLMVVADVRVAQPLDVTQTARLTTALNRIYGRAVHLQVTIDPAVAGGVQVRVGDEVLDGTVARRLGDVRRRLAS
jgi:F-type H+-transporting ATPase subunit delta